jgi:glycosyltransferase involved in cell wall biosynthesis
VHVLHLLEASIGGTRRHVVDACRGLVGRGVRTTLVASALREPGFRRDLEALAREGVEVRELAMVRPIRPAADYGHLARIEGWLRDLRPEVVHTHSSKAGVLGRLASLSSGVGRRVHTPHTFAFLFGAMFGGASRTLFRLIEAQLAGATDRFVAVSEDEAGTIERSGLAGADKLRVVPNGVDPRRWAEAEPADLAALGIPPGARVAVVAGLLNVAKGQDLAIEALARTRLDDLHLLVLGHGETEGELRALAERLGVARRTLFLGWRDDVPRFVAAADFVVVPSRWEAMPYVVLEAMAAGKPVVASAVDGARGVIAGEECGALAPVGDVDGLAAAMLRIAEMPREDREILGRRGRRAVERRYTTDAMVDGLLAVYRELA